MELNIDADGYYNGLTRLNEDLIAFIYTKSDGLIPGGANIVPYTQPKYWRYGATYLELDEKQ